MIHYYNFIFIIKFFGQKNGSADIVRELNQFNLSQFDLTLISFFEFYNIFYVEAKIYYKTQKKEII
jgi:hypothetical protein